MKRFVIIGSGNAGLNCAKTLRKYNKDVNIIMISDENYTPYCRCLLTYYIENKADEKILFHKNREILKKLNVEFIQGEKVELIESKKSRLKLTSKKVIHYDKLFIGAGASPKEEIFEDDNSILVTNLRKIDEAKKIKDTFKRGDVAVVEGGGLVSLKTLLALYEIGVKIYWVIKSPHILSFLIDKESANIIEEIVLKKGIELIKKSKIIGIKNKFVKLDTGIEIKADGVVIGKGVKANEIPADVEISFDDGYVVNEYFETGVENIYAGGDCAKIYDIAHNRRWKVALWPIAGVSGIFAAKNMVGKKAKFKGAVPVNSFSVFDNDIIAAGKKKISDDEFDKFFEFSEKRGRIFRKFIVNRDNNLKGFVFINDIFKAGPFYYEIGGGNYERNIN